MSQIVTNCHKFNSRKSFGWTFEPVFTYKKPDAAPTLRLMHVIRVAPYLEMARESSKRRHQILTLTFLLGFTISLTDVTRFVAFCWRNLALSSHLACTSGSSSDVRRVGWRTCRLCTGHEHFETHLTHLETLSLKIFEDVWRFQHISTKDHKRSQPVNPVWLQLLKRWTLGPEPWSSGGMQRLEVTRRAHCPGPRNGQKLLWKFGNCMNYPICYPIFVCQWFGIRTVTQLITAD